MSMPGFGRFGRSLLALVVGVLVLSGCTSSSPSARPTPRPPVSTPTTPTPTPTATATRTSPPTPTAAPSRSPATSPTHATPSRSATTTTRPPVTPVPGTDNRVYVLGDSVLLGTTQTLPAALAGWRVTMNCVGSRRLTQAIPLLQSLRPRLGAVVVIQMGNNYIAGEDGSFASQVDQAMRVLAGVRRVVWVTVAEKWPKRVTINRAIRAVAARWPTMRVADWAPLIAAHPSYAYDMLHLTPSGRLAMAHLIAVTVGPAPH